MADPNLGLLLKLPSQLGCDIVSKWLKAKSCSNLDIAYCSHAIRGKYFELLSRSEPVNFAVRMDSKYYFARMRWMNERSMRCSLFAFGSNVPLSVADEETLCTHLQISSSCISNIFIAGKNFKAATAALRLVASCMCAATQLAICQNMQLMTSHETADFCSAFSTVLRNSAVLQEVHMQAPIGGDFRVYEGVHLPVLRKATGNKFTDQVLTSLCTAAPNVRVIVLVMPKCTGIGYAAIGKHCQQLERISCSGMMNVNARGGSSVDEGIVALALGCPKLTHFVMEECAILTDIALTAIAMHCTQLECVEISDNSAITDAPLISLAQHNAGKLQYLMLRVCENINGSGIEAIAALCPLLHTLDVNGSTGINMECIKRSIPHLVQMKNLFLCHHLVDDELLQLIAEHMLLLEGLDICSDTDPEYTSAGLIEIALKCEKLTYLNLCAPRDDGGVLAEALWVALRPDLNIHHVA